MTANTRPAYGRRLLPVVLDELAQKNPNRLYAAIPKSGDVTEGFHDITVTDVARAVDFMANWIIDRHGYSNSFETISFIGIADLRGPIVFLAAVKAGYKVLLPSPRNPPAVNISLMEQTGSTKLLHATEMIPTTQKLVELNPHILAEAVPSFDEMLTTTSKHIPFLKDFDEARNDPVVVLHSSGSTGTPKPITMTHGSLAVIDHEHDLPDIPGRKRRDFSMWAFDGEARVYTVFPFFHLAGFVACSVLTIFMNSSPVLGPPNLVPDGTLLRNVLLHQKLRAIFLPPAVIEQVLHSPNGLDLFKTLDLVVYAGAPMNSSAGDRLCDVVDIAHVYGSTETYSQPELAPLARQDWAWHEFNPVISHEMRLYDKNEGTYEYIVIADEAHRDSCGVYHNLPGVTEYETKDLFTRHPDPEKSSLYKYYGRRDDIIVLANGEKFNPVPAEMEIAAHQALRGAFITGNKRTRSMLLIEPATPVSSSDMKARETLIGEIWPLVEKSNALISGQGRVSRDRIICATMEKPFTRTPKGTIVRKLTQEGYQAEIDAAYAATARQDATAPLVSLTPVVKTTFELSMVTKFVRTVMAASYPQALEIGEGEDLFNHGLDSIQTLEIVAGLKRNLAAQQTERGVDWITPRVVFRHSTVAELSQVVYKFLNEGEVPLEDSAMARVKRVNDTVWQYTHDIPERTRNPDTSASRPPGNGPRKLNVALVGSTGYLGNHLLVKLLQDPRVGKIYALNRSANAQERQEAVLENILPSFSSSSSSSANGSRDEQDRDRITYLKVDISLARLGLSDEAYNTVVREVDVLIYNAWRLDFGISLRSFDPFLRATRSLVDLAGESERDVHVVFVSSLSSVGGLAQSQAGGEESGSGGAKEELVEDPMAPWNFGYADSKHVAERILGVARQRTGMRVSIVRLGQIGGLSPALMASLSSRGGEEARQVNGAGLEWTEQPWISALAKTARALRTMPRRVTMVNWFPVDTAAAMLRDVAVSEASLAKSRDGLRVYHVVHTEPQPWDMFVRVVAKRLGLRVVEGGTEDGDGTLTTQPLLEWVAQLRALLQGGQADSVPAVKMLDMYSSLGPHADDARWENKRIADISAVQYPALDEDLLGNWLSDWKF